MSFPILERNVVQSVNLSSSFSEERRKKEREREKAQRAPPKWNSLSLSPVFVCSSSCFLTAFNKLFFLRERVRVLNPKKRQLFFLSLVFSPLYARAKRRQTTVFNTTPSRAFGKEERDEDSLENTVSSSVSSSLLFVFCFCFSQSLHLVPFVLLRRFFPIQIGFLSLVPSPII